MLDSSVLVDLIRGDPRPMRLLAGLPDTPSRGA
jgi:hypothetical protein